MKKYAITMAIGLVLTALLAWSRDILEQTALVNIFHILCDSFFVVGVVLAGFGALVFVSNEGAFDGIVYGVRSFAQIFRKAEKRIQESYFDFRSRRAQTKFGFAFILICGLILIAVSLVMYVLYCKYSAVS